MKCFSNGRQWFPESEKIAMEKLKKELDEMFDLALFGKLPVSKDQERFIFVICKSPYGLCMERQSDNQIFEWIDYKVDLTKPVDRKYFKRYATGHDL